MERLANGATKASNETGNAMTTFHEYLRAVQNDVADRTVADVHDRIEDGETFVLVDIRESVELADGHIDSARLIPRSWLELRVEEEIPVKAAEIVLYCSEGIRSALAVKALESLGYSRVSHMSEGFRGWKRAGYAFTIPKVLGDLQRTRYARHISLPEVGEKGQQKLLDARVLLVGAGGLGCPAALYLAAAGVGTIGVIDADLVDRSNLQRQVLHFEDRVGTPKVESASQTLSALNPDVRVVAYNERLTAKNVERVLTGYNVVVDGGDNFPTRYLVNDACVHLGITNVHGSVHQFEGQATVFHPDKGPCYRCLYPDPPPPEAAPNCQEAGILGVVPGLVGLIQATETLKAILDIGTDLVGRLLLVDARTMSFREIKLRRDPQCKICGDDAVFEGFVDYERFCASK